MRKLVFLKTDKNVTACTGLPSTEALENLLESVTLHALSLMYWRQSQGHVEGQSSSECLVQPGKEAYNRRKLVMTFMKLHSVVLLLLQQCVIYFIPLFISLLISKMLLVVSCQICFVLDNKCLDEEKGLVALLPVPAR